MIASFHIFDIPAYVYVTEIEAMNSPHLNSSFVISFEDLYSGLHCDGIPCNTCPIKEACDEYHMDLPFHVIATYAPYLIADYPEYFI